jgi:hypothetical protein
MRNALQIEQLAQATGLRAANGNLGLLLVVHAQLVAGLEPRHDLADVVDVDHEAPMGAPEKCRVKEFEQFLQGAALGVPFEGLRDDANDAFVDGGVANLSLIDQQQAALRLDNQLGRAAKRALPPGAD